MPRAGGTGLFYLKVKGTTNSLGFLAIKDIYIYMAYYHYTSYFEKEVLRKRPYLKKEWCIRVLENPFRVEPQEDNRWRFWPDQRDRCQRRS